LAAHFGLSPTLLLLGDSRFFVQWFQSI